MSFEDKNVALYISGGIAAYKMCELVRQLIKAGANVKVAMTLSATEFVTPLTLQILSKNKVYTDLFDESEPDLVSHIHLADWADIALVAPATANLMAKLAHGLADDFVTTSLLAVHVPVVIAPAMNTHMWHNSATVQNKETLTKRGLYIIEPDRGFLAEGYEGDGRLPEISRILDETDLFLQKETGSLILKGKRVLVTAGGTKEDIDPVRFITNKSSGKMGYALAMAARNQGAEVTLVTASSLPIPVGVKGIKVRSAEEMKNQVFHQFDDIHILLMAAAVSDYRPEEQPKDKIKKTEEPLLLALEKTVDILSELGKQKNGQYLVGFAAETNHIRAYAQEKLKRKNLDLIAANDVSQEDSGFNVDTNELLLLTKEGEEILLPSNKKEKIADDMIRFIATKLED